MSFFTDIFRGILGRPDRFLGIIGDGTDPKHVVGFEEAVGFDASAAMALDLKETKPTDWKRFYHQFQSTSGSCVAFTIAKIAQILYFLRTERKVKFSPGWIYRKRRNRPKPGMSIDDVVELAATGMIPEELYPSENLSDKQMDALEDVPYGIEVAGAFSIPSKWVNLPLDFDTVAKSLIKTEKGIMVWFRFGKGEFFNRGIPISNGSKQEYHHSVTATEAVRYKGKEYILIEDSADTAFDTEFDGRKLISRDWFAKHVTLARYPLGFKFDAQGGDRPSFDGTVASLQDCLTYEGIFPANITARGHYGSITTTAVIDFQRKYGIEQVGTVGPKTSAKLRELYP